MRAHLTLIIRSVAAVLAASFLMAAPAMAQKQPPAAQPPAAQPPAQPPQLAPDAYSVERLHPEVRRGVTRARENEARAINAAEAAREAAPHAERAAERARAGQGGHLRIVQNEFLFETEVSNGLRNGYGVSVDQSRDYYGDRYTGTWSNNQFSGVGVLVFGQNPNNRSGVLRYEGEYGTDRRNGAGILYFRDGARYAGIYLDNRRAEAGVFYMPNGTRYEGEYDGGPTDRPNGFGVLWGADGRVLEAGQWRDGVLVNPLSR